MIAFDPRLAHLQAEPADPECFICGRACPRAHRLWVESDGSPRMAVHESCIEGMPAVTVFARYQSSLGAAIVGTNERAGHARVRGRFL